MKTQNNFSALKGLALITLLLGGCALASIPKLNEETAARVAGPAWMVERDLPAGIFELRVFERMHERYAPANVYIEGDGGTPRNPLALHLASKDKAENLVYIARPCQYSGLIESKDPCDAQYTGNARYGEDVIQSFNVALDEIAKRYDITGFNLIGYDGGAAVATLLAAERKDVLSVRTVAGVLDHKALSDIKKTPPLTESYNPVEKASALTAIPQFHFVGGQDGVVPPAILQSYMQATPPTRCIQTMMVQEAAHDDGWVNKWPELLELPVTCYSGKAPNDFSEYDMTPPKGPLPFMTVPEKPEKP